MAFMPLTWQSWKWQLSLRTMLIQYDSAIQKQTKLTQWLSAQRSEGQLVDSLVPANKERNKPENSPNLLLSSVWGTKRTKKCLDMEASVICIVSVEQSCQDKLGTNSIQKYPGPFPPQSCNSGGRQHNPRQVCLLCFWQGSFDPQPGRTESSREMRRFQSIARRHCLAWIGTSWSQ